MSQASSEERRKFVFVFTGPVVNREGKACEESMRLVGLFADRIQGWTLEESHNVPLTATIQIGGKTE